MASRAVKIALIGGSGFIGRALAREAHARGHECVVVARSPVEFKSGFIASVQLSHYRDQAAVTSATAGSDVAILLAGRAHVLEERDADPAAAFLAANRDDPVHVAQAFARAGGRRLIFVSSIAVNGVRTHGTPFRETDPPNPASDYGRSKLAGEVELADLCGSVGLELAIVRPPLVYGPGAPGNFGALLRAARGGWPLPLGSIRNRRDFIGIGNLCDLLLLTATHPAAPGQTFLASDGETTSTAEVVEILYRRAGYPRRLLPCPPEAIRFFASALGRPHLAERLIDDLEVDSGYARARLGWRPPISLEAGLYHCFDETRS